MYETYIKWLMNPFYDLNAPIKSQARRAVFELSVTRGRAMQKFSIKVMVG